MAAKPTPRQKAPGRNVKEAERSTVAVKLRLPPDVAEDLDTIAARWRVTRAGAVARMVEREQLETEMRGTVGSPRG